MKVSIISHSGVATRQAIFYNGLSTNHGIEVQQIYPLDWNNHRRMGGYPVSNPGDMMAYQLPQVALDDIARFRSDILYLQNEAYCKVAPQIVKWVEGPKFVIFVWENIREYEGESKHIIESADYVICGNKEAEDLVKKHNPKTTILPQVGIDFDLFKPMNPPLDRTYDGIFVGRPTPEKGIEVSRQAFADTEYQVWYANGIPYHGMPKAFNRAKVNLVPSLDTPVWKEQFAPFSSIESLGCGCYIVASQSAAIMEWLASAPGVALIPQGSPGHLGFAVERFLEEFEHVNQDGKIDWKINAAGMNWAREYFSCQAVGDKLIKILGAL